MSLSPHLRIPGPALAAALAAAALWPCVALAARFTGQVVDPGGRPVQYASVAAPALRLGVITDSLGRFALVLPAGRAVIEVRQLGYQAVRVAVTVPEAQEPPPLRVVLREAPLPVEEVTVTASSFGKTGKSEGAVISREDVVGTPGGAADIFHALRALPGINAPNEGAAVYVRGGDPRETLIRLDGGSIGHPYHYEGASGGLFSTIDSYMLKSAFFSSGGFGARYGGVLSGVLDIETQDPLSLRTVSLGVNLAGVTASTSWALAPDRLSLVTSWNHSFPELLFRLYGSASTYQTAPSNSNGFAKLVHRYSGSGRLALAYLEAHNRVGVVADYLNVAHTYDEQARSRLLALQLHDAIARKVALQGQVSLQRYDSWWAFGPVGASQEERNLQANLDLVWPLSDRHELSAGFNLRRNETDIVGDFPADSTDLSDSALTRRHETRARVDYPGLYAEAKVRLWGPLYSTLGGRFDRLSPPGQWTSDPRAALALLLGPRQTIRVAAGRYHQPPDPRYLDPVYGNPRLGPLRADHVIAGYEWKSQRVNLRLEAFRKQYRGLVTQDLASFYANGGHGYARGVDAFLQGSWRGLSGWISYGYLDSRRKELDHPEEVPASYGVQNSVTLVGTVRLLPSLLLGAKYNAASGRPFTPVVNATYDPVRDVYRPVYGPHNSRRLPDYQRLDIRLTRRFSLGPLGGLPQSRPCAFYVEGLNVLGIRNVLDYVYDPKYRARYSRESYFSRRLLVAGFTLTW